MTTPGSNELLVRAAIRDELSGPLEEIRRELAGAGREAEQAGRKANAGARGFDSMARGVGRLAKSAGGLALRGAAGGITALSAVAVASSVKLIGLASDAEETANVFATVLGKGSPAHKAATAFVQDLGKSSGIATADLQGAVGKFAVLGKQAGKTGPDLAKFSTDLVQAGLDLGSFYNKSPDEVFAAIQSGLTGEAEALKSLNIFMSDAALNTYALEQGMSKTTQQMTEQEKVALRQSFIMANLGDANGDLARTSDGFANRLRYLQGRLKEVGTVIGTALLPYGNALVTMLGDKVGGQVEWLNTIIPAVESKITGLGDSFEYLRNRFAAGGLDAVVSSLDNMTGSGGKLEGAFGAVRGILDDVGTVLRDVLTPAIADTASAVDPAWLRPLLSPLGAARLALGFVADNADVFRVVLTGLILALTIAKVATLAHTAASSAAGAIAVVRTATTALLTGAVTTNTGAELTRNQALAAGIAVQARMVAAMVVQGARYVATTAAAIAHAAVLRVQIVGAYLLATATATAHGIATGVTVVAAYVAQRAAALASATATGVTLVASYVAAGAVMLASAVATGVVTAASYVARGAALAWAAGQWLLNAALTANPIGLVVAGIALLVGGLVLAYRKSETFRGIVSGLWELIKASPLGQLVQHFDKVKAAVGFVIDAVSRLIGAIKRIKLPDLPDLNPFGDTATSRARGAGGLGNTLAAHARYSAAAGGGVKVTNALIGGGGRGHGSGDHQAGRALDLVGPRTGAYARAVRADGGFAAYHGNGRTRHLHAVPAVTPMGDTSRSMVRPRASSATAGSSPQSVTPVIIGEGAIVVQGLTADEARQVVAAGIRDYVRDAEERA